MAKILLKQVLEQEGKSLYWLWKETGIGHTILLRYQHNTAQRITLAHIDLICQALGCKVSDILQAQPVKLPKKKAAKKR